MIHASFFVGGGCGWFFLVFVFVFLIQREGLFQWEGRLAGLSEFLEGISSTVCECCGQYAELGALKTNKQQKPHQQSQAVYAIICDERPVRLKTTYKPTWHFGDTWVYELFLKNRGTK